MLFSIGVETPENSGSAWGIIVPALSAYDYGCVSAADTHEEIAAMAREAILLIVEEMLLSGKYSVEQIEDGGVMRYAQDEEYADYDRWFVIEVDLSAFSGKPQRINISLPDTLLGRIDRRVSDQPGLYRDRSHFLATAARRELLAD